MRENGIYGRTWQTTVLLIAAKTQGKGQKGQPDGTVATSPADIDAIIRERCGNTYAGNVGGQQKKTEVYMEKHSEYIFRQAQANSEDITAEDLETMAKMTADSAAGMDQWAPGDINMLSKVAFKMLAKMMNAIERGSPWPEQLDKN